MTPSERHAHDRCQSLTRPMIHPGQTRVIGGVTVLRQAFRFVIAGLPYYCVEDALEAIEREREL